MTKHIHIHIGTKDAQVQPADLKAAQQKAQRLVTFLNSRAASEMNEGDFKEGYKALTSAANWFS